MISFDSIRFKIWGIPGYLFFSGLALVISFLVFIILCVRKKYKFVFNPLHTILSVFCVGIFSKIFGVLSVIYRYIGLRTMPSLSQMKESGIVFYGGLFGLIFSSIYCNKYSHSDKRFLNIIAVCIPLFHSIARVGCFTGGCCFGVEAHSHLSVLYTTVVDGKINTAYRVPIQLFESLFELLLFFILLYQINKKEWEKKEILRMYIIFYSVGRFILEFFRGDYIRGLIREISFSQFISICIWFIFLLMYAVDEIRKEKEAKRI